MALRCVATGVLAGRMGSFRMAAASMHCGTDDTFFLIQLEPLRQPVKADMRADAALQIYFSGILHNGPLPRQCRRPSSHVLFFFLVCARHSVNTCLADCIPRLHGQSGESNPGTFLKCRNFLRPIFSVLICIIRALAALQRPLCNLASFLWVLGRLRAISCRSFHLTRFLPTAQGSFAPMLA